MSASEPMSTRPHGPTVPKIIRILNAPLAHGLTAVAMFGAMGLLLGAIGTDCGYASLLLQVTAQILGAAGVGYGLPTGVWAVRARLRGQLPPARDWAAPIATVGVLLPFTVFPLLLVPLMPVFVVCLGFTVAGIVIIRFRTAPDGRP